MLDGINVEKTLNELYKDENKKKEIFQKVKNTCLERYGDENYSISTLMK